MSGLTPPSTLSYQGQLATPYITEKFPPNSSNYRFPVPTIWVDTEAQVAYILVAKPDSTAVWDAINTIPETTINTIHTPDGTTVVPTANNVNFLNGTAMNITGSGSNITFNSSTEIPWTDVTSGPYTLAVNNAYTASSGGSITFVLPSTCAYGSVISIINRSGGWSIHQNALQQIHLGNKYTMLGPSGSLSSTALGDSITLICTVANTEFYALNCIGNITVV
jgi:hypothetical protein